MEEHTNGTNYLKITRRISRKFNHIKPCEYAAKKGTKEQINIKKREFFKKNEAIAFYPKNTWNRKRR